MPAACNNNPELIGQKYGRLTITGFIKINKLWRWVCSCECGNSTVVTPAFVKRGTTQSCGCFARERRTENGWKHGEIHSRLYKIWANMKDRCYRKTNKSFKDYGARGIEVCDDWKDDFSAFHSWSISHGYCDDLSIDRIDNNKGYSPENCRWATKQQQQDNRRMCIFVDCEGEQLTLTAACKKYGMPYGTVRARVQRGWNVEKALNTPLFNRGQNKHPSD